MQLIAAIAAFALAGQAVTAQPAIPERKEVRDLTTEEWNAFTTAVNILQVNGTWMEFAENHSRLFQSGIHNGPQFLPWHREFLKQVENQLREYVPTAAIPYWDWTIDAKQPNDSPVFEAKLTGGFPSSWSSRCVPDGPFVDFEPCLERNVGSYRHQGWDAADLARALVGAEGSEGYELMRRRVESLHNMVHVGVGGNMNSGISPYDPIFYMHHAMIDKIWADWQEENPRNVEAYEYQSARGEEEELVGYPGIKVKDTFRYVNYRQPGAPGLRGPLRVSSPDEMDRTAQRLRTLTLEQLAQIPRTCPAPERPSEEERGMFWSPETEEALAFSEMRVNLELEGDGESCLNLAAAQKVLDAATLPSAEEAPTGITSLQTALIGAGAVGVLAVVAAVVVIKRRSATREQVESFPVQMQAGSVVAPPSL